MRRLVLGGLAVAIGVSGAGGGARSIEVAPDDIIAGRQAGFDLQQGVASAMKAGVESGADVKQFEDGAKGISSWGHVIPTMFPEGTQAGHQTKAKPEIWSNRAAFEKAAANLYQAADKLATLAAW